MKNKIVIFVLAILLATGTASATSIVPDQEVKNVPIGGSVSFTLTLTSSYTESGTLTWQVFNSPPITASIDGAAIGAFGTTPSFAVIAGVPQTHTLTVYADATAVPNQLYDIQVNYLGQNLILRAMTTPAVDPIPEMNTMALTSVGMIGLLGMVFYRRKIG